MSTSYQLPQSKSCVEAWDRSPQFWGLAHSAPYRLTEALERNRHPALLSNSIYPVIPKPYGRTSQILRIASSQRDIQPLLVNSFWYIRIHLDTCRHHCGGQLLHVSHLTSRTRFINNVKHWRQRRLLYNLARLIIAKSIIRLSCAVSNKGSLLSTQAFRVTVQLLASWKLYPHKSGLATWYFVLPSGKHALFCFASTFRISHLCLYPSLIFLSQQSTFLSLSTMGGKSKQKISNPDTLFRVTLLF